MGHKLKKADVIFLLGSNDTRVAEHAIKLFGGGWALYLAISGDGTKHEDPLLNDTHGGATEADVFAKIAIKSGVPEEKIIVENTANNTQENFERTAALLIKKDIKAKTVIVVQKPYMERRAYATGKLLWPHVDLILTSPPGTFEEYVDGMFDPDYILNIIIGDLERIKEYPKLGFQIEQEIPEEIWDAFEYLVSLGYDKRLLNS